MDFENDPIGYAIWDYSENGTDEAIIVKSDLCDDDIIPVPYLFRSLEEMPELEQLAIATCTGKTLDIGAGAGCHSLELLKLGVDVQSCEISQGASDFMLSEGINSRHININNIEGEQFDTLLLLMNGLGLAGTLKQMPTFLKKLKSLLNPGGKIICDSADIRYLFEDQEGGTWIDLNAAYYGEMQFDMRYKKVSTGWFNWIYIDRNTLKECCSHAGLSCDIIYEGENHHYLCELKVL